YDHLDEEGAPAVSRFAPYTLLNANLTYTNLITPGLTASIGAYDILDEKPVMPQAYNGDFAPVSGRSREYVLRIAYTLPLSKEPDMKMKMTIHVVALVFTLFLLAGSLHAQTTNYKTYSVFLYSFTKYIEWPQDAREGDFVIAVVGNQKLLQEMQTAVAGRK